MKIFISWSGEKSKKIAGLIRNFLVGIFRDEVEIFLSTRDIEHGEQWFNKIINELSTANYGVFIITDENKTAPWMLFEAGVLYRGVSRNRLSLFLIDNSPKEICDPLNRFNMGFISEEELFLLVKEIRTINKGEMSYEQGQQLRLSFDFAWAGFEKEYNQLLIDFIGLSINHQNIKKFVNQNHDMVDSVSLTSTQETSKITFKVQEDSPPHKDDFVMQAYIYDEPQNWLPFITGDYKIRFDVEMNNIEQVMFELKTFRYDIHNTITKYIKPDEKHCEVSLDIGQEKSPKLRYVKELCFLTLNPDMKKGECEFSISNLRIEK